MTGAGAVTRAGATARRLVAAITPLVQLPWVPLLVMASAPVRLPRRAEPQSPRQGHLDWERTDVFGRPACYGVAGAGQPVVFLHGWALGQHAYKRALKRIVNLGYRVYAPALPGFGGTADLASESVSFAGYAEWLDAWLATLSVDEPVSLVGHSFGGAVAIKLAHDRPERVRSVVLVDAIGHPTRRAMWQWGVRVPMDLLPMSWPPRVIPSVLEDALPNVMRNPMALWRVARLARGCDLTSELGELRRRRLAVTAIWGSDDRVVPRSSFEGLCASLGSRGAVVEGNHSWPLAEPEVFAKTVAAAFAAAERSARRLRRRSA